ncbi:MAG: DUF167 domain-containing protein [Chloroflexi bacterium]|nr:DUF167 domain-containing protein [Chloroflexota bacterium]
MPSARIRVRVQPNAKASAITGVADGVIQARVAAPPVEGRANAALEALLAERLGIPKSRIRVVRGAASRDKVVEVEGLTEAEALQKLNGGG